MAFTGCGVVDCATAVTCADAFTCADAWLFGLLLVLSLVLSLVVSLLGTLSWPAAAGDKVLIRTQEAALTCLAAVADEVSARLTHRMFASGTRRKGRHFYFLLATRVPLEDVPW